MIDKEKLDSKIEQMYQEANIPGLAVVAAHKGNIMYEKYAGFRDVANKLPVTSDTIFGLASLTKSVVALSIMMLQDKDKIDVTDRVVKWIPELKQWNEFYKQNITIHHLLTHTAGFSGMNSFHLARRESVEKDPDGTYLLGEFNGNGYVETVRDLIEAMMEENAPFIAKPGEIFNYSNESYALLQEVVERASGQTFAEFTHEHIFQVLGMTETMYTFNDLLSEAEVTEIYAFTKEHPKKPFHSPTWWKSGKIYGAGALKASAKDVQKYIELYRANGEVNGTRLISAEAVKTMKTPQATTPNGVQYGYGLVIGTYQGEELVGHGGGVKGISSYMLAAEEITVVVLTNIAEVAAENIAVQVFDAWKQVDDKVKLATPEIISLTEKQLARFVGFYETNERQSVDVTIKEGGLQLRLQNNVISHVKPIGNDQFLLPDGKKVTFLTNADGEVQGIFRGMRYIQKGSDKLSNSQ